MMTHYDAILDPIMMTQYDAMLDSVMLSHEYSWEVGSEIKWWVISETVSPEILTPRTRRRRRTWNMYKFKKAPPLQEGPNDAC